MKNLKRQLQDYLKGYMADAKHFSIEDFKVNYPTALDIELTQTLLMREDIEKHKILLTPDERRHLSEADQEFLQLWENVKHLRTENPHVKLAIGVLSELVELLKKDEKQPTQTTA